jgi:Na+-driven multidrug efflux pump
MMLVGMGLGVSSLIGHNLGADKYERAKKTANQSILMGIGVMTIMGIFTFFFAEFYMKIFFNSQETVDYGVTLLKIWVIGFPAIGVFIMLEMIHSGVGLNMPFMIISFIHCWALQVLPAIIVTQYLGFDQTAVWWVLSMAGIVTSIGFYFYYRRGKWLTVKV